MGHPLSQTPGPLRKRAWRERVTMGHPMSQTPDAQRQRKRTEGLIPLDAPDMTRPTRPCSRCGSRFQPSTRRRMLCADCHRSADEWYESRVRRSRLSP